MVNSNLHFNMRRIAQVAAFFIILSITLTVLVDFDFWRILEILPNFLFPNVYLLSWTVGLIIFAVGLCINEEPKVLRVSAGIMAAVLAVAIVNMLVGIMPSATYLWLTIDASLILFVAGFLTHENIKAVKVEAYATIAFIVVGIMMKFVLIQVMDQYGISDKLGFSKWMTFSLSSNLYEYLVRFEYYSLPVRIALSLINPIKYVLLFTLLVRIVADKTQSNCANPLNNMLSNAFRISARHKGALAGAIVLWLLTIWIPYFNIGATVGMFAVVIAMSQGRVFSATEIFSEKYRKQMGGFILLSVLMTLGIAAGFSMMIIPGIVLSVAWSQAALLQIDKGLNPLEAIAASNEITYGNKCKIVFTGLLLGMLYIVAQALTSFGIGVVMDNNLFAMLISIPLYIFFMMLMMGLAAYIYSALAKDHSVVCDDRVRDNESVLNNQSSLANELAATE